MEEDFINTIDTIIKINKSIKDLYMKLAIIEQKKEKNSKEYSKIIKYLKTMTEVEDIYYQKINKGINTYYEYLFAHKYKLIDVDNIDEDVNERITNYIVYRSETATDEETKAFFNKYFANQINLLSTQIKISNQKLMKVEKYMYKLILNTYIYFIEQKIKQNPKLIKEKYRVFTIYKHMEKEFIKNNFDYDTNLFYIDDESISKYFNINKNEYREYFDFIISKEYIDQMQNLLEIKDEEYKNEFNEIKQISEECFLRTLFVLSSKDLITCLNETFHNIINDNEFIKQNPNINNSIDLITRSFKKVRRDRNKVKVIKLT